MRRKGIALLVLALAPAGCGDSDAERAAKDPMATPTAATSSQAITVVGGGPCDLTRAGGAVWVSNLNSGSIQQIDPDTAKAGEPIKVEGSPCWLAGDETTLWVAPSEKAEVIRFDARTGERTGRVKIGKGMADPKLALAYDSLWATVTTSGELVRIDPETLDVTARIKTGKDPRSLLAADGLVWVANERAGTITAIDPDTNKVARRLDLDGVSWLVAWAGGDLWASAGPGSTTVLRLDPEDGRTVGTYPVDGNPGSGTVIGNGLWIPNHLKSTLSVVSLEDGKVETVDVGEYPSALLQVRNTIWVANYGDGTVSVLPIR